MKLHQALRITPNEVIAFTGAGGKTSVLVRLGAELYQMGLRVLSTTTTRIGEDQLGLFPQVFRYTDDLFALRHTFEQAGYLFTYSEICAGKVYGFTPETLMPILNTLSPDVVLIEADGARQRLLKAPYDHEPVIIPQTTLLVPVVSALVVNQPLDEAHVYNAQAIAEHIGCLPGAPIQPEWIATLFTDAAFALKGVPASARVIVCINGVTEATCPAARVIAHLTLASPRVQGVVLADTRADEPVIEIYR